MKNWCLDLLHTSFSILTWKLPGTLFAYSSSELIRLPFTAPLLYFLTA